MSLTVLHVILSLSLVYSQFCRAVKTDHETAGAVLAAFYLLTAAAMFSLFAPVILPGWQPSWDTIGLLTAITVVQGVTARYWRHGTPEAFKNDSQDGPEVG